MASIIGEKKNYRSADGWNVADKIFGYIDETVNIYNKGRSGAVEGDVSFEPDINQPQIGMFGLPKPWGGILLVVGVSLLGFGIYKIAK